MLLDLRIVSFILPKSTTNASIIYVTSGSSERMMVSQPTHGGNVAARPVDTTVVTVILPDEAATTRRRPELAPREREVLLAWILNDNKDDVARQLEISATTVRTHLQRIREKYAAAGRPANTKAALVARAIQDGLVDVNDL
jgi:DNA-binding CsgD family transcriptional regulator